MSINGHGTLRKTNYFTPSKWSRKKFQYKYTGLVQTDHSFAKPLKKPCYKKATEVIMVRSIYFIVTISIVASATASYVCEPETCDPGTEHTLCLYDVSIIYSYQIISRIKKKLYLGSFHLIFLQSYHLLTTFW